MSLQRKGNDLVASVLVTDATKAGVNSLTVTFAIRRESDSLYWTNGTSLFDSASEVANADDAQDADAHGLYELTLTGGASTGAENYFITISVSGAETWDQSIFVDIPADIAVANTVLRTNTAQAGAANTITLDASASTIDDFYNETVIAIDSGTGVGQARFISDYVGSTNVATVDRSWATDPDSTSVFRIIPSESLTRAEFIDLLMNSDVLTRNGVNNPLTLDRGKGTARPKTTVTNVYVVSDSKVDTEAT